MATRPYFDVRTLEGFELSFESEALASGGEKVIFMGKERQHVIGFFHGHLHDRLERKRRLEKILGTFNPTRDSAQANYWKAHFCWPVAIVDSRGVKVSSDFMRRHNLVEPILGVITPTYRPNFFFRDRTGSVREKKGRWFTGAKARRLLPDNEKGDLRSYLQVCAIMSSAVRRLHFAGLAHSDLSHNNVLIDPRNGDACVIDIDSLVVPGVAPPSVLGTPGYIAPEVLAGKKLPSIETDQHALAVLIYESLLLRHPLQGPKVHSLRSAEEDESLSMGKGALYIEHPSNFSNRPNPFVGPAASALGPHLARLLHKTFVDGLHQPAARAAAGEWEKALYKTLDLMHPSPSGKHWFVVERGLPMVCPFSGRRLAAPVPVADFYRAKETGAYTDDQSSLTIWPNMPIFKWHIFSNVTPLDDDRAAQGYFSFHEGKWYLVNQSGGPMCALDVGYLPHGKAVEIKAGLRVLLSMEPGGRLAVFDFLNP